MESESVTMWMIRCGRGGLVLDRFLKQGIAYLGWGGDTGQVYRETSFAQLRGRLDRTNHSAHPNAVGQWTRMILQFCQEIRTGDIIVTNDRRQRLYRIGVARSDAEYRRVELVYPPHHITEDWGYLRKVEWTNEVRWNSVSTVGRRHLDRPPTLFPIASEIAAELHHLCG